RRDCTWPKPAPGLVGLEWETASRTGSSCFAIYNSVMTYLAGLSQRRRQPEIMEQPGLDVRRHILALQGLKRINWWSGSAGILGPPIRALAQRLQPRTVRVLDIATGGGDIPVRLWQKARRAGLRIEVAGCDINPTAVAYARMFGGAQRAEVHFFKLDALQDEL